jgi:hypothetical protein
MGVYDLNGWLKLSPSQVSTILDKCAYKWYLSKVMGYVDISLIDTTFPGRVVHFLQEIAHPMKLAGKYFDPKSKEFKLFVYKRWMYEISKGYRIKQSMQLKYREIVLDKYPDMESEGKVYKKICRLIEKDLFKETLKYCQLYLKEIFPLQKPALDDNGNVKKEQWCTLELPKLKVILRMRYDLLEQNYVLSDTKVLSPTSLPANEPAKKLNYMNNQEQYMYYSMWHWRTHGVVPVSRQYSIKKNKTPLYVELPDVRYKQSDFRIIMEKIKAAKKVIESECFHGNNQSNLCSVDYCGFWPKCKYVHHR